MRSYLKRTLSFALALLLCLSLLPAALAEESDNAGAVAISSTNFPDANFRACVSESFDSNGDGKLSKSELQAATALSCPYCEIGDLKGVERLTALTFLDCTGNALTKLDVSKNTALEELLLGNNKISALDVSMCLKLRTLMCDQNRLKKLDVTQNPSLMEMNCRQNELTALNVRKNPELVVLACGANKLAKLDLSKNLRLNILQCDGNLLQTLDLSRNASLMELSCYSNQLTKLDLSKAPMLTSLSCAFNQLKALDLGANTALKDLDCTHNRIAALDLSRNTGLRSLGCGENKLKTLDLSNTVSLQRLSCSRNQLSTLKLGSNRGLELLYCEGNRLTKLSLSKISGLKSVVCQDNRLTELDLRRSAGLEELRCGNNALTKITLNAEATLRSFEHDSGVKIVRVSPKPLKPLTPALTGGVNDEGKPTLTWNSVPETVKYQIWRSATGKSGSFKLVKTTTDLSYIYEKATLGKTYYFKLRAVNADGLKSDYSEVVKLKAAPKGPELTGHTNDTGKPSLTWTTRQGEVEYQVWRSTSPDSGFKRVKTVAAPWYVSSKTAVGQTHYFKVRAVLANGVKSSFSNVVCLTGVPAAPQLTGSLNDKGKPSLSWEAVDGAAEYQIWRSASYDSGYKRITTVKGLSWTNSKAEAGKTWYYKIRAVTADGLKGGWSSVVEMTAG